MLSQKQKEVRDKKLGEVTQKVAEKQAQIDRNSAQHDELMVKLQQEKDEFEVLQKALESLK